LEKVTNLDIKRHKRGLILGLSPLKILENYRKSSVSVQLELLSLIEIIKNRETNYKEGLELILLYEKASNFNELISALSKRKLEASVSSSVARMTSGSSAGIEGSDTEQNEPKRELAPSKKVNKFNYYIIGSLTVAMVMILVFWPTQPKAIESSPPIKESDASSFINLEPRNGHMYVYLKVNGSGSRFLLDTGASMTMVSKNYINRLIAQGYLNKAIHFQGRELFTIANGDIVTAEIWLIPSLKIGDEFLSNVQFSAIEDIDDDNFLLGMSLLNKLGNYTIDMNDKKIIIKK
jgi:clan AA aspartic protease (TIGR02281 family)